MRKSLLILPIAALAIAACATPDSEFTHDECRIESITVTVPGSSTAPEVAGVLRTDVRPGQEWYVFAIPRDYPSRFGFDPSSLKVVAKLPYDVFLTPGLEGRKDLSNEASPFETTAENKVTGEKRTYYLFAYISTSASGD